MMLINDGVHQWLKCEYMQLIHKNEHAGVVNYGWKLHDKSDIGEYGARAEWGPGKIAPIALLSVALQGGAGKFIYKGSIIGNKQLLPSMIN